MQAAAATITPVQFPFAKVFDVGNDGWLGSANGISLVAQGSDGKSAVAIKKDGSFVTYGKAARLLRYAREKAPVANPDEVKNKSIFEVSMELRFQDYVNKGNAALFNHLSVGDKFVVVRIWGSGDDKERSYVTEKACFPDDHKKSKSNCFPHSRKDADGKESVHWWLWPQPCNLFFTESAWAQWTADEDAQAKKAGESAEDYAFAVGSINEEILRVAHAIGSRAKARPFDMVEGFGDISIGKWRIVFAVDGMDMMTIRIERTGTVLSVREDLHAVRMSHMAEGGVFGRSYVYSELGARAYADWLECKART